MLNVIREERAAPASEAQARAEPAAMSDRVPMLQHADVWRGIDRLAAKHGLSAWLWRVGRLDLTAFNEQAHDLQGRSRWPRIGRQGPAAPATFGGRP
jgi:hypothetical protein